MIVDYKQNTREDCHVEKGGVCLDVSLTRDAPHTDLYPFPRTKAIDPNLIYIPLPYLGSIALLTKSSVCNGNLSFLSDEHVSLVRHGRFNKLTKTFRASVTDVTSIENYSREWPTIPESTFYISSGWGNY